MPICPLCGKTKGKRRCPSLEALICAPCCAASRVKRVTCPTSCAYLGGEAYPTRRQQDKDLNELLHRVPHGQFDDILQDDQVAEIAFAVESFFKAAYVSGLVQITDSDVLGSLRLLHRVHTDGPQSIAADLTDFDQAVLDLYHENERQWLALVGQEMLETIFLRLMISIKKMTGGPMGDRGYLNFLKNNLDGLDQGDDLIVEDEHGAVTKWKLED